MAARIGQEANVSGKAGGYADVATNQITEMINSNNTKMKDSINSANAADTWKNLPWKTWKKTLARLQGRIFLAARNGDRRKLHQLQRQLLRSHGIRHLAAKRVAQENKGKHTAGVDGVKSLTPRQKLKLAAELDLEPRHTHLRRVWVEKPGKDEKRPLSIPTMFDRAQQTLVLWALLPEWESKFDRDSYGFRPRRNAHDAMEALRSYLDKPTVLDEGKFVLDADISGAFNNIDHEFVLGEMNSIRPIMRLVRQWISAGVSDDGEICWPKGKGVPQGSPIGPLLLNIALNGLEDRILSCLPKTRRFGDRNLKWSPGVIRYADDIVIVHRDLDAMDHCHKALIEFLAERGLKLNENKTTVRHSMHSHQDARPGFEFLSFNFRSFSVGKHQARHGKVTLVTPSEKSKKAHYRELCAIIDQCKASDQDVLIRRLNLVIAGWVNYFRVGNSKEAFNDLDNRLWRKLQRWCKRRHSGKSAKWRKCKYWNRGKNPVRFTRGTEGAPVLMLHTEPPIKPHVKVRKDSSAFDRDHVYWSKRPNLVHPKEREYAERREAREVEDESEHVENEEWPPRLLSDEP